MLAPRVEDLLRRRLDLTLNGRHQELVRGLRQAEFMAGQDGTYVRSFAFKTTQEGRCRAELHERFDLAWQCAVEVVDAGSVAAVGTWPSVLSHLSSRLAAEVQQVRAEFSNAVLKYGHGNTIDGLDALVTQLHEDMSQRAELAELALTRGALVSLSGLDVPRYAGAGIHWRKAQTLLAAEQPDLENAAKEAICAVEALAQVVADLPKADLSKCLARLRGQQQMHAALVGALDKLFAFASDADGVRHGSLAVGAADAAALLFIVEAAPSALTFLLRIDVRLTA